MFTQHLGYCQYQVGCGDTFTEFAGKTKTDDIRDKHRHGLTKHRRFRFDTSDAPAEHAETVDHGGVGIGADKRIRIRHHYAVLEFAPDGFPQIFKIYLVANTGAWRHHAKAAERLLAPAQERITLMVALHLQTHVLFKRVIVAEMVDGHRVVNHQINR